jgi:hypothetical protein
VQGSHPSKVGKSTSNLPKLLHQTAAYCLPTHQNLLSNPYSLGPTTHESKSGLLGGATTGKEKQGNLGQAYYKIGSHQIIINLNHKPGLGRQDSPTYPEPNIHGPQTIRPQQDKKAKGNSDPLAKQPDPINNPNPIRPATSQLRTPKPPNQPI